MTNEEKAILADLQKRVEALEAAAYRSTTPHSQNSTLQIGPTPETMIVVERMQKRVLNIIGSVFALIILVVGSIMMYSYLVSQ